MDDRKSRLNNIKNVTNDPEGEIDESKGKRVPRNGFLNLIETISKQDLRKDDQNGPSQL